MFSNVKLLLLKGVNFTGYMYDACEIRTKWLKIRLLISNTIQECYDLSAINDLNDICIECRIIDNTNDLQNLQIRHTNAPPILNICKRSVQFHVLQESKTIKTNILLSPFIYVSFYFSFPSFPIWYHRMFPHKTESRAIYWF